ncbi:MULTISPECIES: hypothetical protein [Mycobacteriaceae]|uniref:Uncharacterized protein n=1 Tax=Mycolicibacterium neoaurum VKM Ac-1815D TaxID=700508 RepID=V5XDX0_MYCNE|nr:MULTISPECIES: hypothetical protein [Mycobacteriaceae]AHC26207.1 hypothetical protein D174_17295 [Mycolicibacterium neoaurum VKM Ac-1815D]AMO06587.1 hypothetical protein MyAD_16950 [Mycolicibacterium neoaurum]AXK75057.1 hypothetical protein DXK33_07995 [Mycolicibacterium neoaurum]KJQ48415.1 hypothetical protein TS71_21230 [Mycolicibacterium neoaurum]KUM06689.1 hypothetical protein AVZ31_19945 [Mycolicibacterium neoaurum]
MKLVAQDGLWTTGGAPAEPPAVAVLEVTGAVLAWTVDDPAAPVHLTFTDIGAADWLWRVVGASGHVALAAAVGDAVPEPSAVIDVPGVALAVEALAPLRRLALGHWLRRWWPASMRDSIVGLDAVVLDAEIATLTAAAQDFFVEDTFDSDVEELLRPHRAALAGLGSSADPRITELLQSCAELMDLPDPADVPIPGRRDDYALAAGGVGTVAQASIAGGTASISWGAVPPSVFDAAEDTVDWAVHADGAGRVVLTVRAAVTAPSDGIAVRFRSDGITADAVLAADGTATVELAIAEPAAWNHDWSAASLTVGGPATEDRAARDRIRAFVRGRLRGGAPDAFLAEVLAAESDY